MKITLSLETLGRVLTSAVAILATLGLGVEVSDHGFGYSDPYDLISFFSLSYEGNLPTWFSASLLLSCSVMIS